MTRRYPDWPTRLSDAVGDRARTPFAYGGFDCSLAACDLILAVCDCEDPAQPFRGKYKTERGAIGALRRYLRAGQDVSPGDLLAATASRRCAAVGFAPRSSPLFAQRGDLALIQADIAGLPQVWVLGVVDLDGWSVLCPADTGWQRVVLPAAQQAWGVG